MRENPQIDTLKSCEPDIAAVEANRALAAPRVVAHDKRRAERLRFDNQPRLPLRLLGPKVAAVTYLVKPRDLSAGGFGFLYGNYLHAGSRCQVTLTTLDGLAMAVNGTVRRCAHLHGKIHEVGIAFDDEIDLSEFIHADEANETGQTDEQVAVQLDGRLLYVDADDNERRIIRQTLSALGIEVMTTGDAGEAIGLVETSAFDLVLVDSELPDLPAHDFVRAIRIGGYEKPTLLLTTNKDATTLEAAQQAGVDVVVPRPCAAAQLTAILCAYLSPPRDLPPKPIVSPLWRDREMRPLIVSFLDSLGKQVEQLHEAAADEPDSAMIHKLCLEIKGHAGSFGYPQIGETAQRVFASLTEGLQVEDLRASIEELTRLCQGALKGCVQGRPAAKQ